MTTKFTTARLISACAALCATLAAPWAAAAPVFTVTTTDQIYGAYSGSIASGAVGSAATLTWQSAGYFWGGDIALTDALGKIVADITTNYDDVYHLYAAGSGFATLGSTCVAGSHTACVQFTSGTAQSLLPVINALNGGSGICCGSSNLMVTGFAAVPEPGTMLLVGTAITGLLVAGRRRRAEVTLKA